MNAKLVVLPIESNGYDHALYVTKYGIENDIKYFDYHSLVRMYGKDKVDNYLKMLKGE